MMKIWLKYLIATIVGVAAGLIIPMGDGNILDAVADVSMNIARYALLPLVFFSVAVAGFELHEEKRLSRVWLKTVLYSVATVFFLTLVGLAGAFLFTPGRIPLSTDTASSVGAVPEIFSILAAVVSVDALSTLLSFDFLLPAASFALILGLGFAFDKAATKPVVALFDSLSRIFWQINSFFVEILPLPLIVAAAARTATMGRTPRLAVFRPLLIAIGIETAFVVLVLVPLVMWLVARRRNPYKTLVALAAPAIAALVSGNTYVQAGVAAKHLKESLGVRRRSGSVSMPLALAFGRAGTAMVTATAFVAILNSYSNLGLGSTAVVWMMLTVPAAALLLGAAPGAGPIIALAALCTSYGRGFESGYILLVPAALPLAMTGAFVDSICMSCVIEAVASREGYTITKDLRHYI
jgi:Na+/H+-dicarboxylate symporter